MSKAAYLLCLCESAFDESVETYVEIGGERFTIDEFKDLIGRKSVVTLSIQELVDEYNKKTKRNAKIVIYKNGKKIL